LLEYETRAEMNESALGETSLMEQQGCPAGNMEVYLLWPNMMNIFLVRNHQIVV
jgi:hypothetical protein